MRTAGARIAGIAAIALLIGVGVVTYGATALPSPAGAAPTPLTAIYIDHEDDAWPPMNYTSYYAAPTHTFSAFIGTSKPAVGITASQPGVPRSDFSVRFGAPGTDPLVAGTTYVGGNDSGPAFLLDGSVCGAYIGRFTVHEYEVSDGNLVRFAATFESHCTNRLGAQFGEVRYNSTLPLAATSLTEPSDTEIWPGGTRTFSVTNLGTVEQDVAVSMRGEGAADYQITANNCGDVLGVGETCEVDVAYSPRRPGPRMAWLAVTDATVRGMRRLQLIGVASEATTTVEFTATPGSAPGAYHLVATLAAAEGMVQFIDDEGALLATSPVSVAGTATADVMLAPGSHWLVASATGSTYVVTDSLPVLVNVPPE